MNDETSADPGSPMAAAMSMTDRSFPWKGAGGAAVPGKYGVKLFRPASGPWALSRDPQNDVLKDGKVARAAYTGNPDGGANAFAGCAEVPESAMGQNASGKLCAFIRFNGVSLDITTQQPPDNCGG